MGGGVLVWGMSQAGEGRDKPFVTLALKQKALIMIPLLLLCPRALQLSRDLGLLTTVLEIGPRREVPRGHAGLEAVLSDTYLGLAWKLATLHLIALPLHLGASPRCHCRCQGGTFGASLSSSFCR